MGFDPGLNYLGFGVIQGNASKWICQDAGVCQPQQNKSNAEKLEIIFECLEQLFQQYRPDYVCIEKIFLPISQKHSMKAIIPLGYARGILLLCAQRYKAIIYEFTPLEIKKNITGVGQADKEQVMYMVEHLLKLPEKLKTTHEADALAVALCLAYRLPSQDPHS